MQATPTTHRCPRCGSDFVRRTRPQEPREYLLRLLHVYPFQCQVCSTRFTKYQTGEQRTQTPADRRNYQRIATALRVTISGDAGTGEGVAGDLSMDGCNLRTTLQFTVGDRLQLSLHPQGETEPIVIERALVRSVTSTSAGVQFVHFSARGRERLSRIVRQLLTDQRTSA